MIIAADKNGRTDSAYHAIKDNLKIDPPIVIVSWVEDFIFNDALLNLKEYVLICFCEYGWNYTIVDSHIWGSNTDKNGYGDGRHKGAEWDKFDNWVKENPFKIMLKRELLKKDVTEKIKPIEYPCVVEKEYPIQSEDQFNLRPINVFQYWGRSNEIRLKIHADIWYHAFKKGFQPCDNIYYISPYLNEEKGEKWITLWIPHYSRVDIKELLNINLYSKLCLSWAGAGFKCFRTAEAPLTSIMVMHKNKFAWTFDWNETNCILVEHDKEIEGIEEALQRKDLHEVYVNGVENANKYRSANYFPYLESIINNA
jgi:hypothetical protein